MVSAIVAVLSELDNVFHIKRQTWKCCFWIGFGKSWLKLLWRSPLGSLEQVKLIWLVWMWQTGAKFSQTFLKPFFGLFSQRDNVTFFSKYIGIVPSDVPGCVDDAENPLCTTFDLIILASVGLWDDICSQFCFVFLFCFFFRAPLPVVTLPHARSLPKQSTVTQRAISCATNRAKKYFMINSLVQKKTMKGPLYKLYYIN